GRIVGNPCFLLLGDIHGASVVDRTTTSRGRAFAALAPRKNRPRLTGTRGVARPQGGRGTLRRHRIRGARPGPRHRCESARHYVGGAQKKGYDGSSRVCPHCQQAAKFQRWQAKTWVSVVGPLRVERAYYYCPHCHEGHCPWDRILRVCGSELTPAVTELTALAGLLSSFEEARAKVLPRLAGLRLSASTVERTTEFAGERLRQARQAGQTFGPPRPWAWGRQAAQVGLEAVEQWVALTDGGAGLEEFMRKNFPRAECILDFYHAAEHLNDLAKAWCATEPDAAAQAQAWCHQLKHEGGAALLATLEGFDRRGKSAAAREVYRQVVQYVRNHAPRMDYPRYQAQGWLIGSGHVEAGCKVVVGQRLKGSGMRWSAAGADAVCHLRALFRSEPGQWEAFWSQAA